MEIKMLPMMMMMMKAENKKLLWLIGYLFNIEYIPFGLCV